MTAPRRARGLVDRMPPMTEAMFQRQVTDLAALLGWWWVHFRPAQTAHGWRTPVSGSLGKGWPDLVLARERDRRIVFAELKAGGTLTPEQGHVLEVLRAAGAEAYVWRPGDIDRIAEVLR